MDQRLVARELLEREPVVGGPSRGARGMGAGRLDAVDAQPGDELSRVGQSFAVYDDVAVGGDPLGVEEAPDLVLVDGPQPGGRERDGARDVAAARLAVGAPAVVGGQRPDVDDGETRVAESFSELVCGDGGHRSFLSMTVTCGQQKAPVGAGVPMRVGACDGIELTPTYTTCPAWRTGDTDSTWGATLATSLPDCERPESHMARPRPRFRGFRWVTSRERGDSRRREEGRAAGRACSGRAAARLSPDRTAVVPPRWWSACCGPQGSSPAGQPGSRRPLA